MRCPHCGAEFTPEAVDVEVPTAAEAECRAALREQLPPSLASHAAAVVRWALFCLAGSGLAGVIGLAQFIGGGNGSVAFQLAGGLAVLAFGLGVIGQLLHIRAALEDIRKGD